MVPLTSPSVGTGPPHLPQCGHRSPSSPPVWAQVGRKWGFYNCSFETITKEKCYSMQAITKEKCYSMQACRQQ